MDTGYQFQPALTGHWLLSLAETPDESPERWNNHRNVSHHIAATTSLATRFSGQGQVVWYGAEMDNQIMVRAVDSYRNEARFRALASSAVSRAFIEMREHGGIDPEDAERGAHDLALKATAILLQTIYEDDEELRALRERIAQLEKLAFNSAMLSPPRLVVMAE